MGVRIIVWHERIHFICAIMISALNIQGYLECLSTSVNYHSLVYFLPVPPDILDDESSSDTLATEGMRVLLNCHARGNPTPTISWVRLDAKPIRKGIRSINGIKLHKSI
jgi:hypothetical protein